MNARQKMVGAGGGVMLLASLAVPVQAAQAAPQVEGVAAHTAAVDCVKSDPDTYNFQMWHQLVHPVQAGYATFREYGETLTVQDSRSDGRRVYVDFDYCFDGAWRHKGVYSSGPDEGPTDIEKYDFSFKEGRKVRFRVKQSGDPYGSYASGVS